MALNFNSESKGAYIFWTLLAFAVGVFIFSISFSVGGYVAFAVLGSPTHVAGQDMEVLSDTTGTSSKPKLGSEDKDDDVSSVLSDNTVYSLKDAGLPKVTSKEYLIGDMDTGRIILEKNATTSYPFASVTKLMTALVSKEIDTKQHDITTISTTSIATYGTAGELVSKEKIVVGDLFYGMLLESSNDAAEALAEHYGRDQFLKAMNDKAAEIGMVQTHFLDASGLSPKNVSTAEDLFKLSNYIRSELPDIYDITRVKGYNIYGHNWVNHNHFLNLSTFYGGKNGFTDEALYTTVALFTLPLKVVESTTTVKHTLAIILLQSKSREADVQVLLNYIKNNVSVDLRTASSTAN